MNKWGVGGIFIYQGNLYVRPRWYTLDSFRKIKIWNLEEEILESEIKNKGHWRDSLFSL